VNGELNGKGDSVTITLDEITKIVGLQLGARQVSGQDNILHDLGAESMDIVNIVATLEEKYAINIDETSLAAVQTVAELHQLVQSLTAGEDYAA
jgi:acyl carrier protein